MNRNRFIFTVSVHLIRSDQVLVNKNKGLDLDKQTRII